MLGRDTERACVERSLDSVPEGGTVIAVEGLPGIGKTTLWREAVDAGRRRGFAVLTTAPREPDADLAFAGLADLLDGLPAEALDDLPVPQRHALSSALVISDDAGAAPSPRALPRAAVSVLRGLAERAPVLLAIDDEQWLDGPTARVLAFALPRLADAPVGVLVTHRSGTDGLLWTGLAVDHVREGLTRVTLDPLDPATIDLLLTGALGRRVPRPLLQRIHATSGGNPLYALAIARDLRGTDGSSDLPIPRTLLDAVAHRLRDVGERAQQSLLAVAATSHATLGLLHALDDEFVLGELDAAIAADVVEVAGERVRFTHPLLASTHYQGSSPAARRAIHRRLAEVVSDPQQRARHLALGAEAPDAGTAWVIEHAAGVAAARGAPETAAGLFEEAARLTPVDAKPARWRRLISAAEMHDTGGDVARCRTILTALIPELPAGLLRGRALHQLAWASDDFDTTEALEEEALRHAHGDDRLRARIMVNRAGYASNRAEFAVMHRWTREALAAAERARDPGLMARALAEGAVAQFFTGQRVDVRALARAVELEDPAEGTSRDSPSGWNALILFWSDDYDAARPAMDRAIQRARVHGEQYELGALLFERGLLEWYAGNVALADSLHAESRAAVADQGLTPMDLWLAAGEAMFAARRGDLTRAGQAATRAIGLAHQAKDLLIEVFPIAVLAAVDLWAGRHEQAHQRLHLLRESFIAKGFGFLGSLTLDLWAIDVEALLACGRLDDAQRVADDLRARADIVANPNAAAIGARCAGLVSAARGNISAALDEMQAALDAHAVRTLRPEMARSLLEYGILQRRAKQKLAGQRSLEQALAIFEEIEATRWAARARDELSRVGLRRTSGGGLTPAQARVIELVCEGLTNQQIAAVLHMSSRSVESHLTKAYRDHGVKSRAQLVAAMAAHPRVGTPAV